MNKQNSQRTRTKSIGIATLFYMVPLILVAVLTTAFTSLEKGELEEKTTLLDSLQSQIDSLGTHQGVVEQETTLQTRLLGEIDSLFDDWQIKAEEKLEEGDKFLPDDHHKQLVMKIDSLGDDMLEAQIKRRLGNHHNLQDAKYNLHVLGDSTSNYGRTLQRIEELDSERYQLRRELLQCENRPPPTCPSCEDCEAVVRHEQLDLLNAFVSTLKDWEDQRRKDLKTLIPTKIKELERQVKELR